MLALKTEACLDPLRVRLRLAGLAGSDEILVNLSAKTQERKFSKMKRAISTAVLGCALAGMFAVGTMADELSFFAPVVGSNPGLTIAGVASGGAAWVVREGRAVITDDGRVRVEVHGLVLPSTGGTTGPVSAVSASVVCANTVVATSGAVSLSPTGDAEIRAKLTVPSPCVGAVVLVRAAVVNGTALPAGPFIAATGIAKGAQDNDANDNDQNDGHGHDNR
jgi:hypothetical protein